MTNANMHKLEGYKDMVFYSPIEKFSTMDTQLFQDLQERSDHNQVIDEVQTEEHEQGVGTTTEQLEESKDEEREDKQMYLPPSMAAIQGPLTIATY